MAVELFVGLIVAAVIGLVLLAAIERVKSVYVIVPPGQAHYVATRKDSFVACSDSEIGDRRWYFNFSENTPLIGRSVRVMHIGMQEKITAQETYEKNQARFEVTSSAKYRIKNVLKAAQTYPDDETLKGQMEEVIKAAVRAVTAQFIVEEVRTDKNKVAELIEAEIKDDFGKWGLVLESFQLVGFSDTTDSSVISDISQKREAQIKADTKISIAQKDREAREAIAEADKEATMKEIEAKQEIQKQEELSQQEVEKEKAKTVIEEMAVKKERDIAAAEIEKERNLIRQAEEKEKKIIKAEEEKEVAGLHKEARELQAAAERKELEERAIGDAAKIRADKEAEAGGIRAVAEAEAEAIKIKLLAEAEGKKELADALAMYGDDEIKAMVAERIVAAQEAVGLENAKALASADVRVFLGESGGAADLGKAISALQFSNDEVAKSITDHIARPNDLGFVARESVDKSESGWAKKPQEPKTGE